jgi:hypothetical protein
MKAERVPLFNQLLELGERESTPGNGGIICNLAEINTNGLKYGIQ